jgi:hypothetical protein
VQIAHNLLVLFHLIGFAALLGGLLVQVRAKETEVNASMLNGSFTLLLTGLALVTVEELEADRLNYVKIAIKLLLMAVIVVLVAKNRKFATIPRGLWGLIGGLTIANAGVAVLWQ